VADALQVLRGDVVTAGFASVDYADLRDAATLEDLPALTGRPARLLVAARIGTARLIDNMAVG
jgi:pantoate--beta-alanine ligase